MKSESSRESSNLVRWILPGSLLPIGLTFLLFLSRFPTVYSAHAGPLFIPHPNEPTKQIIDKLIGFDVSVKDSTNPKNSSEGTLQRGPSTLATSSRPMNFIFFERERQRISEASFLENKNIVGAQLKYTWRELEPERDRYHFQPLIADLEFLQNHGKRLFVQLQDISFSEEVLVPEYLCKGQVFGGGVDRQYDIAGDDESKARFGGWVARRWDPAVRARFEKLLDELGKAVDGRIEGLNLSETAVEFGESGKLHPKGFTYDTYREGVQQIMTAARKAFPRSCVIQYANFMPGEWLPWEDHGALRAVYAHAQNIGVGVGGPDLMPHRKGQQNHSYPLIAERGPKVRAGVAVQDGNLEDTNPATGKRVMVADLYRFATDRLRLDYLFWGTQEPFYSKEILPFIQSLRSK